MNKMMLKDYLRLVWRWSWLILLSAAIAGVLAYYVSSRMTPVYSATTTLLSNHAPAMGASPDLDSLRTSESLARTYVELVRKRPVLDAVIANLDLDMDARDLAEQITVKVVPNTQLMTLTVEDTDPMRAARIANEVVSVFSEQNQHRQAQRYAASKQSLEQELARIQTEMSDAQAALLESGVAITPDQIAKQSQLRALLGQYSNSYATVLNSYEAVRLAESQTSDNLEVVEAALPAETPTRPKTRQNALLAALVAALAVMGLVVMLDHFDDSVRSSQEVEDLLGISTLAATGRLRGFGLPDKLVMLKNGRSNQAEVYRMLGITIDFSVADRDIRTIMVASSESLEGKSLVVTNLAIALAQSGKRVILVDTNLRRPTLHTFFRQPNTQGVTTALAGQGSQRVADYLLPTGVSRLSLMPSGPLPPNPTELLGSQAMLHLIQALRAEADVVLFDSPSLLSAVDATLLARLCDAALLIVMAGGPRPEQLRRAKDHLSQSGTRILGTVLNRAEATLGSY